MRPRNKPKLRQLLAALLLTAGGLAGQSVRPDCCAHCPKAVPDTFTNAPAGSLCDLDAFWETDSGNKVKLGDLNGRVRVISMFYATCEGVCVITKEDMQSIEASLSREARKRVGFVLVTLDSKRDTTEALRKYRRVEGLSSNSWTLLRGDDNATSKLAALLGIGSGRDPSGRFVHSSELVVVDELGRVLSRQSGLRADLPALARQIEAVAILKPKI